MSPRPLLPSFGGPSPRRRCTVPCWVPAGTRMRFDPDSVGTSTVAPRIASTIVIGTSTSRFSPLRLNTGESVTRVIAYRSPVGPPRRPASPLPASRTRLPSRTPAGMFTRYFLTWRVWPVPWQVGQGSLISVPVPPHLEQGWEIEKRPWPCDSMPRPWQREQTCGEVPGFAPVPPHVGQGADSGTVTGTCAPSIACSNEMWTSVSRSRPRSARGAPLRPPGAGPPPAPPNRSLRMSPMPPKPPPPELKPPLGLRGSNPPNSPPP